MADIQLNSVTLATESGGTVTLPSAVTGTGGLRSMQVFSTAGTFTDGWVKPANITTIKVYVTGSGGGGAGIGGDQLDDMAEGGASGGTAIEIIDVTSVVSVTVIIGTGGSGGGQDLNGGSGNTSSFGSYCTATGGGGGRTTGTGAYCQPGIGSGGNINLKGTGPATGPHFNHSVLNAATRSASAGGSSFWGGGGRGGMEATGWSMSDEAATAGVHGSGGGGGIMDYDNGANGGAGIVVIEEYS
jgi:hypothetical protein